VGKAQRGTEEGKDVGIAVLVLCRRCFRMNEVEVQQPIGVRFLYRTNKRRYWEVRPLVSYSQDNAIASAARRRHSVLAVVQQMSLDLKPIS
jgi:hypothetical protein